MIWNIKIKTSDYKSFAQSEIAKEIQRILEFAFKHDVIEWWLCETELEKGHG